MIRSACRCAALVAAAAAFSSPVLFAQDQPAQDAVREPTLQESKETLHARNRSLMHPGDPLALVGVEQGDNDIRSRTPALMKSDRNVQYVDPAEAYSRALAIHASRATFTRPPAALAEDGAKPVKPRAAPAANHQPLADRESSSQWPWLVAFGVMIAFMVWLGRRFGEPSAERRPGAPQSRS